MGGSDAGQQKREEGTSISLRGRDGNEENKKTGKKERKKDEAGREGIENGTTER